MYSPHSLTHYKLRIVTSSLKPNTLRHSLTELCATLEGDYLFALEIGSQTGKEHLQGFFSNKSSRPDTVKIYLKKYFQFNTDKRLTNNDWSCVADDAPDTWERYERYCVKDNNVIATNYDDFKVKQMYDAYWVENAAIDKSQRSFINKNQKKKVNDRETHYQNVIKKLDEIDINYYIKMRPKEKYKYRFISKSFGEYYRDPDVASDDEEPEPDPVIQLRAKYKKVMDVVIDEYADTFFTLTLIEPVINRVMMYYFPAEWKTWSLQPKLWDRFFPREDR